MEFVCSKFLKTPSGAPTAPSAQGRPKAAADKRDKKSAEKGAATDENTEQYMRNALRTTLLFVP